MVTRILDFETRRKDENAESSDEFTFHQGYHRVHKANKNYLPEIVCIINDCQNKFDS